jgi:hypothetical protein
VAIVLIRAVEIVHGDCHGDNRSIWQRGSSAGQGLGIVKLFLRWSELDRTDLLRFKLEFTCVLTFNSRRFPRRVNGKPERFFVQGFIGPGYPSASLDLNPQSDILTVQMASALPARGNGKDQASNCLVFSFISSNISVGAVPIL